MKSLLGLIVLFGIGLVLLAIAKKRASSEKATATRSGEKARARPPLTPREEEMFLKLLEAFPQPRFIVLSQVAFTALLTAETHATRNGFNRKVADFVLCDGGFAVIAVIELDDASHRGREDKDAARDSWLTDAGYRVQRYAHVPAVSKLHLDFLPPPRGAQQDSR